MQEVLILARTPADLRRAATLHKLLPEARRVVVAVLDTPASHPAPVPTPTPAHRWRSLTDLRVYQPKDRVWVVDARFSAPTPAGRTVAATARAFAGHRLDVITAPAAAIAGVGAAAWRPGRPERDARRGVPGRCRNGSALRAATSCSALSTPRRSHVDSSDVPREPRAHFRTRTPAPQEPHARRRRKRPRVGRGGRRRRGPGRVVRVGDADRAADRAVRELGAARPPRRRRAVAGRSRRARSSRR